MARKSNDQERLVQFALSASEEALQSAVNTLTAIFRKRFPAEKKKKRTQDKKEPEKVVELQ